MVNDTHAIFIIVQVSVTAKNNTVTRHHQQLLNDWAEEGWLEALRPTKTSEKNVNQNVWTPNRNYFI